MSVDHNSANPGVGGQQLTDEDVINLVREAIKSSREDIRRNREESLTADLQPLGITVDLGHRNIARLPEEVVDIIKGDIERLAISHNRVSAFPARLAECKRLRYLNVRYNALREVPKPILQLSSLEILDISRNKLRLLPEEIRNLTSLKVLAIQRNKIEKLPLCLGDMNRLLMIKLDDNPITFPPPEIWRVDPQMQPAVSGAAEIEAQVTASIKKYLKQVAGAASNRQRLAIESDSDLSESAMETPRPHNRQPRARFPVRPSLSGLDTNISNSMLSPEPPSGVLDRTHARMRSFQNPNLSTQPSLSDLLSPPDNSLSMGWMHQNSGEEITLRSSKRHGIVTPRNTDPSNFVSALPGPITPPDVGPSPIALHVNGSAATVQILPSLLEVTDAVENVVQQLIFRAQALLVTVDWTNRITSRDELTSYAHEAQFIARDVHSIVETIHADWDSSRNDPAEKVQLAFSRLAQPLGNALELSDLIIKFILGATGWVLQCSTAQARNLMWMFSQLDTEISGIMSLFANLLSESESFAAKAKAAIGIPMPSQITTNPAGQSRTYAPGELTGSNPSHSAHTSVSSTLTAAELDHFFDRILQALQRQVDYSLDDMVKLHSYLLEERQLINRAYGSQQDGEVLSSLILRTEKYLESVDILRQYLGMIKAGDPEAGSLRLMPEFWIAITAPLNEFSELGQICQSIKQPSLTNLKQHVRGIMKPLHLILKKEVSTAIKRSPWADWLSGAADPSAHKKTLSGSSVPPTPLSAALGPAAQAAVPVGAPSMSVSGGMLAGQGKPPSNNRINFSDRFEKYQASQQQQQQQQHARSIGGSGGYGRRY